MVQAIKSERIGQLCDGIIAQLEYTIRLLQGIRVQNGESRNAAAWLANECRSLPYEGSMLCVRMGAIFAEMEAMEW